MAVSQPIDVERTRHKISAITRIITEKKGAASLRNALMELSDEEKCYYLLPRRRSSYFDPNPFETALHQGPYLRVLMEAVSELEQKGIIYEEDKIMFPGSFVLHIFHQKYKLPF